MQRPIAFISHIHEDMRIALELESVIRTILLGGFDTFNTSNRASLTPGDRWGDRIIQMLRDCSVTLVIATPESVTAPWVNFESGGAWLTDKQVIPCCAKGMTKSSLPAPLRDLQAVELSDPHDVRYLIEDLASRVNLDKPTGTDYTGLATRFEESWKTDVSDTQEVEFATWLNYTMLRPSKWIGQKMEGSVTAIRTLSVDFDAADLFKDENIVAGDSVRVWVRTQEPAPATIYYCFANDEDADKISQLSIPQEIEAEFTCIGQVKRYATDVTFGEDRRVEFYPAYVVSNVTPI